MMANKKQITKRLLVLCLIIMGGMYEAMAYAADPRNGASLYKKHCDSCHGAQGRGGNMPGVPNFSRGEGLIQSDAALVKLLEEGRGIKPAYRGLMTTREMLDVVAYLRTLH